VRLKQACTTLDPRAAGDSSELFLRPEQGRNEVRWRPGQEASSAPPFSNLRSLGSKCTVLKKALVTLLGIFGAPADFGVPSIDAAPPHSDSAPGESCPLAPIVTPLNPRKLSPLQKILQNPVLQRINSCSRISSKLQRNKIESTFAARGKFMFTKMTLWAFWAIKRKYYFQFLTMNQRNRFVAENQRLWSILNRGYIFSRDV